MSGKRRQVIAPRLDDFVEKMLASLHSYSETVDLAVFEFGCDERTVTRSIARVREKWMAAEASTVVERRAKFRAELEHAWQGALAAGDYRAIAVMSRTRADIEGIKAPKETKHSGTVNHRPVPAMSPQERDREIQVLLAKRQAELSSGTSATPAIGALPPVTPEELEIELAPAIRPAKQEKAPAKNKGSKKASKPRSKTKVH